MRLEQLLARCAEAGAPNYTLVLAKMLREAVEIIESEGASTARLEQLAAEALEGKA